jgi:D-sedoheptulose 7-phosphate isomerase
MDFLKSGLTDAKNTLEKFSSNEKNIKTMMSAIDAMVSSLKNKGKILSCGNGGSLCDAMHFAEELTGRFRKDRPALAAISLSDPSHITCVANDYGYKFIFSRMVEAFGQDNDMLLAISTSGNSENVIEAVKSAKAKNMKVIGLLGKGGGELAPMVDFPLVVDNNISDRIQEVHIKIIHLFIEGIERQIFPLHY